jgi:hypothetical protein
VGADRRFGVPGACLCHVGEDLRQGEEDLRQGE